jgi:Ni/Fe-hydrogenase subunit HybB-like protein
MIRRWWIAFGVSLALLGLLAACVVAVLFDGVGVWGNNVPVTWALDIVGYDWWIGVASGGLLVSALLLLTGAAWRDEVNRMAETMALIAAAAAGLYPIIHLGRPWFFYWNLPYPNTFLLWPQFRSPLYWDAVDIISFLVVCLCFWFVGMLPDLAAMRDRAVERLSPDQPGFWVRRLEAQIYGIAAIGWRGSAIHWQRWDQAYHSIAVLAVVLVISLQTGAAVMFAGTVEPGWHDVLAPITFLVAALFAGVAVVAVLLIAARTVITRLHIERLAMLLLALGLAALYCNAAESFTTVLTGSDFDRAALVRRFVGSHAWSTWAMILCALLPVHLFWLPACRRSRLILFWVGLLVAFGLWADHFMEIVASMQQDFLPSAVHPYSMDMAGIGTFLGTSGLFLFLLLLSLRLLPFRSGQIRHG